MIRGWFDEKETVFPMYLAHSEKLSLVLADIVMPFGVQEGLFTSHLLLLSFDHLLYHITTNGTILTGG